jgi:hypothetical protein
MNDVFAQTLNHREGERRRLPGSGVGGRQQVTPVESRRHGLALDLGGLRVTYSRDGFQQPGRETQLGKSRAGRRDIDHLVRRIGGGCRLIRVVVMCFQVDDR